MYKLTKILIITLFFSILILVTPINEHKSVCKNHSIKKALDLSESEVVVNSHEIRIDAKSVENINVTEDFTFTNLKNSSITAICFWINHSCSNIIVKDVSGNLVFNDNVEEFFCHNVSINLGYTLPSNHSSSLSITYYLDSSQISFVNKDYYQFEFYSSITYPTEFHRLSIKLPERCYLYEGNLTSVYPSDCHTTVVGQRLLVSWNDFDLIAFSNPFFFIRFIPPPISTFWALILGPILGFSLGLGIAFWLMRRKDRKTMKQIGTFFLNESQKTMLRTLIKNEGKLAQSELCKKTGFSRSKISRNLVSLEEQGLISKERWGRNALIRLTKSGEKVVE